LRKQGTLALGRELIIREAMEIRKVQKRLGGCKLLLLLGPFLRRHGLKLGRDALFSLLREHRLLVAKRRRNKPQTTFSSHWMRKYPNRAVQLEPCRPEQLWVSDITAIRLVHGDAFLSLVTDAYSRKTVGYHLSADLSARGCVQALQMALSERHGTIPSADLIHHSDRGVQYCCKQYVSVLNQHKITISMTQSSDPRDNAIAERVNGILKGELLDKVFSDLPAAVQAVAVVVNTYNYLRPHSSISMLTPALAHSQSGVLERRWKNYYKRKEVVMDG
jgi:putative transposase